MKPSTEIAVHSHISPLALSSSVDSDGLASLITLKSIVKKSKWSWTSTTKSSRAQRKQSYQTNKNVLKSLTSCQTVDFLSVSFFFSFFFPSSSPPKVGRLHKFKSREWSLRVHAPLLRVDVGYWWEVRGGSAATGSAPSRTARTTAPPAGGNAVLLHRGA